MREFEAQRWCIIHFGGAEALVTIDKYDPNNFHWSGGITYCCFNKDSYIVEELGTVMEDDDKRIDEMFLYFRKNFNQPRSWIEQSGGWLSPHGNFYPCGWHQHDSWATSLAAIYYDVLDGCVELLESKGWIRMYDDGIPMVADVRSFIPTSEQMKTLSDILNSPCRNSQYKENLERNTSWWAKNMEKKNVQIPS